MINVIAKILKKYKIFSRRNIKLLKFVKGFYYPIMDNLELVFRRRDRSIPPNHLNFVGATDDFISVGREFFNYFVDIAKLKSSDTVLDVGCGSGRIAIPLTKFIDTGEYWGFDIVKQGIIWCRRNISRKYRNFYFHHTDLYNKFYNPDGKTRAEEFKFPFKSEFFDFVYLISVFTHMTKKEIKNYLSEVARILKKGGKCFITFFISNEESIKLLENGLDVYTFTYNKFDGEFLWTRNKNILEMGVAYEEKYIKELYSKNNLRVEYPIHYGSWCGRKKYLSLQDIIIATKPLS